MNKRIAKRKKQKRKKSNKAFFIARNGMTVKSMPFLFCKKKRKISPAPKSNP